MGTRSNLLSASDTLIDTPEAREVTRDPQAALQDSTHVFVQRIQVPFEYPVFFTEQVFHPANATLARAVARVEGERQHKLFVVVDAGVAEAWPMLLRNIEDYVAAHARQLCLASTPEILPGGEAVKRNAATCEHLQARMQTLGIDRHSYLLAIGGGAFLDMAGYAAATTHRGVRLIRMPTTVLGQNDSGVGVKNSINAFGIKNFLGTFAPPFAVINDSQFLHTLSRRDRIAGMAEAVKVALIRDGRFFDWLAQHAQALAAFEPEAVRTMVRRAAEHHLQHIAHSGDPFEFGSARPLDFGHWAAHKLEALTDHSVRHGEAVAIGMALDSCYSTLRGLLHPEALTRICTLLEQLGFRLWHSALAERNETGKLAVLQGLDEFREHLGGELTVTLLTSIGTGLEVHEIDGGQVEAALDWLQGRDATVASST